MADIGGGRRARLRSQGRAAWAAMVIALALVGLWPATAGAQATVPIKLYDAINFGGASLTITGDTPSLTARGFNDRTSSINMPAGTLVAVFSDGNYSGACQEFTGSDGDLSNNRIGDNRISSLWLNRGCPPQLFADLAYNGDSRVVKTDIPDLAALGFGDAATSLSVPAGTKLAVYEHSNYEGVCEEFTAGDFDLRNNPIGNDSISSVQWGKACPPRATLFADRNYGGAHHVVVIDSLRQDTLDDFQGMASSVYLTGGQQIVGYYDPKTFGQAMVCTNFVQSDPDLSNDAVGEDRMSFVRLGSASCAPQR